MGVYRWLLPESRPSRSGHRHRAIAFTCVIAFTQAIAITFTCGSVLALRERTKLKANYTVQGSIPR